MKEKVFRMKIRLAKVEDALGMARVIVDTFLSSNRGIMSEEALRKRKEEWTYVVSAGNWKKAIEGIADGAMPLSCLYVAEAETGEIVGLALGGPSKDENDPAEVGEIDVLYVSESYQRKGIGRALARAAAAHLARFGMTRLHICTPTANTEGRIFYDRIGGQVIGTREDYEDGELIPLVVYEWPDMQTFANRDNQLNL